MQARTQTGVGRSRIRHGAFPFVAVRLWRETPFDELLAARVILTERNEVESESRRQPAVCSARATAMAGFKPPCDAAVGPL